jgi:ketol-acid reductoisomerase
MRGVLERVRNGEFAKEWLSEGASGYPNLTKYREADKAHPVEQVGEQLRKMMPFIK